ncbi:hypothetical protein [Streptococcus suis]
MFKRQQKRAEFMGCLHSLYNEKERNLSQSFREKLIWAAKGLDSGDRLSYLAYQLYPYLMEEMKREEANHNPQFLKAKKYLEKIRWRYNVGSVWGWPFSS